MKTPEGWGQNKRGHEGDPPECHPDRPFHALGLCRQCYKAQKAREYRAAHPERVAEQAAKQRAKSRRVGPGRVPVHGLSDSRAYASWRTMLRRLNDTRHHSWRWYGGRGLDMDPRWQDFQAFYADMGERPPQTTLDRIDNDRGYWPDNCRWATWDVQSSNKRKRTAA